MIKIIVVFLLITINVFADSKVKFYKPSFSCEKVKSGSIEYKICTNENLADLDKKLSKHYVDLKSINKNIKQSQRKWIKERNNCKSDTCLINSYKKRIEILKEHIDIKKSKNLFTKDKAQFKSIVIEEKQFKNASIGYYLYKNDKKTIMRFLYSKSENIVISSLYDLQTGKKIFYEEYNRKMADYSKDSLTEQMIKKLDLKKVNHIESINYLSYQIFDKKIFTYLSGRCGTPFDGRFKIVNEDGSTYMQQSILVKDDFVFISSEQCNNMKMKDEINIPIMSMGIDNIWKIDDDLYAISLFDYPAVLFLDKSFSFINKYNDLSKFHLVDYEWLKNKIDEIDDKEYWPGNEAMSKKINKLID